MIDRAPSSTAWTLALLGVLPFLALGLASGPLAWREYLTAPALIAYGAVIASFLGGARWGTALASPRPEPAVLVLSNLPPLVAWAAVAAPDASPTLRTLIVAGVLIVQLAWDWPAAPPWYRRLRLAATAGAVGGLALGLF